MSAVYEDHITAGPQNMTRRFRIICDKTLEFIKR